MWDHPSQNTVIHMAKAQHVSFWNHQGSSQALQEVSLHLYIPGRPQPGGHPPPSQKFYTEQGRRQTKETV